MSITKGQAKILKSAIRRLIQAEIDNSWKGTLAVADRSLVETLLANERLRLDATIIFLTERNK